MSRRREKPDHSAVESVEVAVVCTGRGHHNVVSFGTLRVLASGRVNYHGFKVREFWNEGEMRKTFPMVCRRCRPARNVPLTRERLERIAKALADTDTPRLDLSALHVLPPETC